MDSVLVIDDDRDVLRIMVHYLQGAGYPALGCETVEAAKMLSGPFSLLVLDASMNGVLRQAWPTVPVLYVTGHGRAVDGPVLRKPFMREDFVGHVHALIGAPL